MRSKASSREPIVDDKVEAIAPRSIPCYIININGSQGGRENEQTVEEGILLLRRDCTSLSGGRF